MLKTWCHYLKDSPEFLELWGVDLRVFQGDSQTVEMSSRLQERKQKQPRNVKSGFAYLKFFSFGGIARGKTDMVGPAMHTMHAISLVKILVGYSPSLLSVRAQVPEGKLSNSGTAPLTKTLSGISTSVHIRVIHRMWILSKGGNVDDTDSTLSEESRVLSCCQGHVAIGQRYS